MAGGGNVFRFGDFTLEARERRLLRAGRAVALRPKAFETLLCLVARHGHLVPRKALLNEVWGGACLSEEVLTHCVAEARKALGEDARRPRYIETVPREGYRFVAEVDERAPPTAGAEGMAPAARRPAIAVLPFANLSANPENEYFCDGLSEELINGLARIPGLRVVAHSSSFSLKGRNVDAREIGGRLGVTRILEGSVRRADDRLRISAQLIDACDGCHLWSEQYDRRLDDVFAIQEEISLAIVGSLKGRVPGAGAKPPPMPATKDMAAHRLYLKGRYFWHRRFRGGLQQAIECFQGAIDRDPGFAPAHTGLGECAASLGVWALAPPAAAFPRAEELARRALALDDTLGDAHALLAFVDTFHRWDWDSAGSRFGKAIELKPGSALARLWNGHYLSIIGRFDEAFAEMMLAQDLDPLSPIVGANLGWTFLLAHQHDRAIEELHRVLTLDPGNGLALFYLGYACVEKGRLDEAISSFERAVEATGGLPWLAESIAWVHGLAGRHETARAILRESEKRMQRGYLPSSAIALIHLGLGDDDSVFRWLRKGLDERDALMPWLGFMPCFDRLIEDARFEKLLRDVGLPTRSPGSPGAGTG